MYISQTTSVNETQSAHGVCEIYMFRGFVRVDIFLFIMKK
jgi:hypothetical protein